MLISPMVEQWKIWCVLPYKNAHFMAAYKFGFKIHAFLQICFLNLYQPTNLFLEFMPAYKFVLKIHTRLQYCC